MPQLIYLSNLDPNAVIKAFQAAMDLVLSPKIIKRFQLVGNTNNLDVHQHIHPNRSLCAVGHVSLVLGPVGRFSSVHGSLSVAICGANSLYEDAPHVPESLVRRLPISLKGTALTQRLRYDNQARSFRAQLRAPLRTFVDHPRGVITIR